ncbi:MAG: hypothetical protein HYX90_03885 [Chloroflexi bacterium]|nr:hypothetical protein [Chloroflexota bacterium]
MDTLNTEFLARRWSDGLPVIPPTGELVERMLEGTERKPDDIIALLEPAFGKASVEKIAINAVMAGCLPVHMPVLVAAVEGIAEWEYSLRGVLGTTNAVTPVMIMNGPIAKQLNINSGLGLLGPGWRANMAIGRALRLITITIAGAWPGINQMSSFGKWSFYCFAENEDRLPQGWQPLSVDLGCRPGANAVTVFAVSAMHGHSYTADASSQDLLRMHSHLVAELGSTGSYRLNPADYPYGDRLLIMAPQHADIYNREGVTKDDIRKYVFEHARFPKKEYLKGHLRNMPQWVKDAGPEEMIPVMYEPSRLKIAVAGGERGHGVYFPTWPNSISCQTREIALPANWQDLLKKYEREIKQSQ